MFLWKLLFFNFYFYFILFFYKNKKIQVDPGYKWLVPIFTFMCTHVCIKYNLYRGNLGTRVLHSCNHTNAISDEAANLCAPITPFEPLPFWLRSSEWSVTKRSDLKWVGGNAPPHLKNLKMKCRSLPKFTTTSLDFRATKNFPHFHASQPVGQPRQQPSQPSASKILKSGGLRNRSS